MFPTLEQYDVCSVLISQLNQRQQPLWSVTVSWDDLAGEEKDLNNEIGQQKTRQAR
jgi:hypothetical protein